MRTTRKKSAPIQRIVRSNIVQLGAGFLALAAMVLVTYWLGERAQALFVTVVAARDARGAAVELRNELMTAESSSRGFLLTGNEIYLSPYGRAKAGAQRQLAVLRERFAGYSGKAPAIERLSAIVAEKLAEMDETVALKRSRDDEGALDLVRTNRGKALMDEANVFFAGLIRAADDRLNAGIAEQQSNAIWLRWFSIADAVIVVLLVAGAAVATIRHTKALAAARDEVTALNRTLEARVRDRTAELSQSRDRAELLLGEVNHRVANSLALVSSLVTLQSNALRDAAAKEALSETQARIFAVAQVHRKLFSSTDVRVVALDDYLAGLIDHLAGSLRSAERGVTITRTLDAVTLPTDTAINLGIVVTEWITNAIKYAYPGKAGEIRVRLEAAPEGRLALTVEDDGVGRGEGRASAGGGLGTRIVSAMASGLKGQVEYVDRRPGTGARLVLPLPAPPGSQS